ncbi:MAG: hypothetical protein ABI777_01900 [Betaproteobacteria bacterium]
MEFIRLHPPVLFAVSFGVFLITALLGARVRGPKAVLEEGIRADFDVVLAATLTLLGLIIGFTFSMAISRYDQRKNLEEGEANAVGTAFVRADLLPPADGAKVRPLLRAYLDQRILFYTVQDLNDVVLINARAAQLQRQLWAAVQGPAMAQPSPITALAVTSINEVLNSQGYTQAAWWNRIPIAAWILMIVMAICCNFLMGYGSRSTRGGFKLLVVLPLVVSIAFMLVADIDTPRRGVITVVPQNLISLAESLRSQ